MLRYARNDDKDASIRTRDVDPLDRRFAGEQANAVRGRRFDGHVAEGQLQRLQPFHHRIQRGAGGARPLHLHPAGIAAIFAEKRRQFVETGYAAFDIRIAALFRLRKQRGLSGKVVCGHIGVFARWHGVDGFVDAISQRLAEAPQLALVLVGDGRTLPAVRELVASRGLSDRVLLPGRVAHDEIAGWIACMDYAVLPDSNQYGSPMKLFEQMAMGVAVVAPDYAPVAEVIDDGRTGWLFPHRQTDVCVQRVLDLATQAEERVRVGAAARDYIARERQWRNNAEQLLTLVPAEETR